MRLNKVPIRKNCIVIVALFLTFFCFSSGPAQATPRVKEWHIPWICFFSGPYAQFGNLMKIGMVQAVEDINASGGIAGKPVVVDYLDSATNVAKALSEMNSIVNDSLVIMGPTYAPAAKAALPLAVRHKVMCLVITAGPEIVKQFQPWAAGLVPGNKDFGPVAAAWAKRNPGLKTVVQFVWPQDPTWMGIAQAQANAIKKMGIKVINIEVSAGIQMGSVAVKALSHKPDGYIISVGSIEAAKIVKELYERGFKDTAKILIFVSADFSDLYTTGKGFLDGAYIYGAINPYSKKPQWIALMQHVAKKYPDLVNPPAWALAFPYDTLMMIKAAIENQGITGDPKRLAEERVKIRNYIYNIKDFSGVNGTISMVDGMPKLTMYLYQIENNKKVLVEKIKPK